MKAILLLWPQKSGRRLRVLTNRLNLTRLSMVWLKILPNRGPIGDKPIHSDTLILGNTNVGPTK